MAASAVLVGREVSLDLKTPGDVCSRMDTHVTSRNPQERRDAGLVGDFPAYGPVEAVLGYAMFYVFVDRATPAVVEVFSETVLDLSPSFVGFGLAAALWFILAVTVIDQIRRQFAALGLGAYDEYQLRVWSRVTPASLRAAGYLLAFGVGTVVAGLTFERAVAALLALIPVVGAVDVVGLVVLVVFSLSYSVATHSLDRLVVDGIRTLASG